MPGNRYVSTPFSRVGPAAAFHPKAAETSRIVKNTSAAVIVPLMVIAGCHVLIGPSVTGWGSKWVPLTGAAHVLDACFMDCSLKTGFGMVPTLYRPPASACR